MRARSPQPRAPQPLEPAGIDRPPVVAVAQEAVDLAVDGVGDVVDGAVAEGVVGDAWVGASETAVAEVGGLDLDHARLAPQVRPGICRQAITSRTTGLLVIGLHAFGQVEVCDETDVGFVYTHTEGDGSDDDDTVLVQKTDIRI